MHCPYCGKPVDDGVAYCPWCGGGLREDTSSPIPEGVLSPVAPIRDAVAASPHEAAPCPAGASPHKAAPEADKTAMADGGASSQDGPWEVISGTSGRSLGMAVGGMGTTGPTRASDPDDSGAGRLVVGLLVAATAIAVAFLAVTRGCSLLEPAPVEQGQQEEADPAEDEPAAAPEDEVAQEAEADEQEADGGVVVRQSLPEYSWEELSLISAEISAAPSRAEAVEVARTYNLVDDEGIPTGATRQVALADGSTLDVYLADVYHDDLVGGAKAGLTFLGWNLPLEHAMNSTDTNSGGWAGSGMRSWLSVDGMRLLPQELQDVVVPVAKLTNNVGNTHDPASVGATEDALWIPSVTEVAGAIDWTWSSDADNSAGYNAVLNAEGSQYAIFSTLGVNTDGPNPALALRGSGQYEWWLRTASASVTGNFRYVTEEGNPCGFGPASVARGVCVGFCL